MNLAIFIFPVVLAIVYPHVGSLAALLSGVLGLVVLYMLPTVTFLTQQKRAIKNPELIAALRSGDFDVTSPMKTSKKKIDQEQLDKDS